jgi:7-cyano-7-deazaguanine synthase in queuosine biosynthesis
MDEQQGSKDIYTTVESLMEFTWICEDKSCNTINRAMYDSWKFYEGKQECARCEKPYRVKEPWR